MPISDRIVPDRFTVHRCIAVAMLLCLGLAAHGQTPDSFTDSPGLPKNESPSARITALLEAVNSGSRETVTAFVQEHLTPRFREEVPEEQHVNILLDMGQRAWGYEVQGLRAYNPPRPAPIARSSCAAGCSRLGTHSSSSSSRTLRTASTTSA